MTLISLANAGSRRPARSRTTPLNDQMAALIERLALSADVDVSKLDRLLTHQDQVYRDKARAAFDVAFANLQLALPIIAENGEIRDRRGELQRTYALWEDINEEIKPILSDHGFSLWFRVANDQQQIAVTGVLSHLGGHHVETTLKLPVDLSGGKNLVQAIGSSTSYGKRYTAAALLNLTSRGDDDDARSATMETKVSTEQVEALRSLLLASGASEATLLDYLDLERLDDLPATRFERTADAIKLRGKN